MPAGSNTHESLVAIQPLPTEWRIKIGKCAEGLFRAEQSSPHAVEVEVIADGAQARAGAIDQRFVAAAEKMAERLPFAIKAWLFGLDLLLEIEQRLFASPAPSACVFSRVKPSGRWQV